MNRAKAYTAAEVRKIVSAALRQRPLGRPKKGRVVRVFPETWAIVQRSMKPHESFGEAIHRLVREGEK